MEFIVQANHRIRDFASMEEGTRHLVLAILGKAPPGTDKHILIMAKHLRQNDLFYGLAEKIYNNQALILDWVSLLNMMFIEIMRDWHHESYDHMLGVRQKIRNIREMLGKTNIRDIPNYQISSFQAVQENFALPDGWWDLLEYAACYHDLGKMAFEREFWDTPGKFSPVQRLELEAHVRVFYYLGEFLDVLALVICLSVQHHYPNLGYPTNGIIKKIERLKVEMGIDEKQYQHMLGLLITVDLYDAMGGTRGYQRNSLLKHKDIIARLPGELGKIGPKYIPLLNALWEVQGRPPVLSLAS